MPVSVPSRARVFISYKRHVQPDESLALALYQVLSVQHDVFLDQKTPVGTRWGQRIDTALEQTDVLLVLLSAEAVCSEMVLEEVKKVHYRAKAQAGQPTILPVRLAYDDALPYPLSAYLDCITTAFWSGPDDTPRLIAELLQAIAGTPLHPGPLSPPVRPAAEEPALQPPLTGNEPASPVFGAFSLAAAQPPNVLATTLRRLRQRLARSWRRLGSGLAVLVFGAYGVQALDLAEMPIPGGTGRAWSLGLALLLFGLTRFPHLARRITRLILGPVPPPSGLPRLFRGPRPYDADEVLPGRQQECDDCWQMLRLAPFFILEGESGCGKSSLLNAALLPRAQRVMRVIACRLADDPFGRLCAALRQEAYRTASTPPSAATLTAVIAQAASAAARREPRQVRARRPQRQHRLPVCGPFPQVVSSCFCKPHLPEAWDIVQGQTDALLGRALRRGMPASKDPKTSRLYNIAVIHLESFYCGTATRCASYNTGAISTPLKVLAPDL